MENVDIAALRQTERQHEMKEFVRVGTGFLSVPLFLLFWTADLVYAPAKKMEFLVARLSIVPVWLGINYLIKRTRTLLGSQLVALSLVFWEATVITYMIFRTEGISSAYYAGLNLVAFGALTFFPWEGLFIPAVILAIYGPFYLAAATRGAQSGLKALTINSFFIIATAAMGCVIRFYNEKLRARELKSRSDLARELVDRELIIKRKTSESVQLRLLAKQFSPQVVESIQAQKIDLNYIHVTDICAIFVDVVDSTAHVTKMEISHVNKVVSMFLEDTMKTFLKYDITIDKFLGDGVLAFSNDPIPRPDFILRVVEAAVEARARIASHNYHYKTYWLNEFQIRIGIASGPASVGFYGSDNYTKTYTALGAVVNLASRLCSTADPDQIVVSSEVATAIAGSFILEKLDKRTLKGFDADSIALYSVLDDRRLSSKDSGIDVCPSGHGVLVIETTREGIYVFMCRTCGYVAQKDADLYSETVRVARALDAVAEPRNRQKSGAK